MTLPIFRQKITLLTVLSNKEGICLLFYNIGIYDFPIVGR